MRVKIEQWRLDNRDTTAGIRQSKLEVDIRQARLYSIDKTVGVDCRDWTSESRDWAVEIRQEIIQCRFDSKN